MRTGKDVIALLLLLSAAFSVCAAETESVDPATRSGSPVRIDANADADRSTPADGQSGAAKEETKAAPKAEAGTAEADTSSDVPSSSAIRSYRAQNSSRANLNSDSGIHLSMDGERPSLAYRFSETGMVRLRGNIRGARVVFSWSY